MTMSMGSFASRVVATKVVATDGTGDFTDIQSAINDLPAGGGVVYIKEGTYTITTGITSSISNISLIGAGNSTIITTNTAMNALIDISFRSDIILNNLNLDGNSKAEFCIWPKGAGTTRWLISQCFIHDAIQMGINCAYDSGGVIIESNFIYDNGIDGIRLLDAAQVIITGNYIYNNGSHGIETVEG